jgi:hypothetical protein
MEHCVTGTEVGTKPTHLRVCTGRELSVDVVVSSCKIRQNGLQLCGRGVVIQSRRKPRASHTQHPSPKRDQLQQHTQECKRFSDRQPVRYKRWTTLTCS